MPAGTVGQAVPSILAASVLLGLPQGIEAQQTEGPYTVGRHRLEVEFDALDFNDSRDGSFRCDEYGIATFRVKWGVSSRTNLEVVVETFELESDLDLAGGSRTLNSGFGEVTARVALNLWGQDSGSTALGLIPYLTFPTSAGSLGDHAVEGGVILPLAVTLGENLNLGLMSEADLARNEARPGYHVDLVHSAVLSREHLVGPVGTYAELFTTLATEGGARLAATGGTGLTVAAASDLQLQAGVHVGLTPSSERFGSFLAIIRDF
jgi:Putative MetA-pathway of phenol degradation